MKERNQSRRLDVLEFLSTGGSMGGEPQATLEAFLLHASPWTVSPVKNPSSGHTTPRLGNRFADE
ncbi:hypothetical protein ASC97_26495 [Rhizobium sp. Root1203]|uniref:hypothetical protein n=1 Tax=Rhizobium sp. Root1203 TaxID=1736427 RepID=UPI0007089B9B|nr:hypothetical protein [Rhizobium sp. Root1203]KQV23565.1 hypothetical protein ASC97_26495 [Rhizobium sp. Root1203]